jgi:hypothetical protein
MMQMFAHNSLKMKEKGLLIYKKIGGNRNDFPLSDPTGNRTPVSSVKGTCPNR